MTLAGLLLLEFLTTFILSDLEFSDIQVRERTEPPAQQLTSAATFAKFAATSQSWTRHFGDANKNLRSSERKIKELAFASDEDRKNHERMQSLIDQLQGKMKSYKKQIEEIAALNLAKYRKVAGALGDAEASADSNEQVKAGSLIS